MNKSGIYKISVCANNILIGTYYGISNNLLRRQKTHWKQLLNKKHKNIKLRRLVCLLGIDAFTFTIIDTNEYLKDKKVRETVEYNLIKGDMDALNTQHANDLIATDINLPLKSKYTEKVLYLSYRDGIVIIKENEIIIGIETVKKGMKIRSGYYVTDLWCNLCKWNKKYE